MNANYILFPCVPSFIQCVIFCQNCKHCVLGTKQFKEHTSSVKPQELGASLGTADVTCSVVVCIIFVFINTTMLILAFSF